MRKVKAPALDLVKLFHSLKFLMFFPKICAFLFSFSLLRQFWIRRASTLVVAVALFFSIVRSVSAVEVPERPSNYVLDQGGMFTPEVAHRLSASLKACAKEYDIHIYVMTVPTLQVMPSRVREKLEELGAAVTESWTKDKVGAVIVFDNEAGWVTVSASDEAERVFSAVAINMAFRKPLLDSRKKHLSPEKLEAAAMVLVNGMTELRIKANQEARRQKIALFTVASIGFGLLIIIGVATFRKSPQG